MDKEKLIENLITKGTKVLMDPMVGHQIFDEEHIYKITQEIRQSLRSEREYRAHMEQVYEETVQKNVYSLCGKDVEMVLRDMGRADLANNTATLKEIVDYVSENLIILWSECVESCIQVGLDMENIGGKNENI